ncbi:hypothetical protein GCM10009853_017630 [Glycomyces scopariae]
MSAKTAERSAARADAAARPGTVDAELPSRTRVLVVGSVNIDDAVRVPRFPGPGETLGARSSDTALGGKGANQAVAAARAGAAVRMVGAVGTRDGSAVLGALDADGIDTEGVARLDDLPSGRAFVFIDDRAENSIVIVPGANHAIPEAAVREACRALRPGEVLLLQNEIPAATSRLAARLAREAGATVVWNAAPAPEGLEELIEGHDLLLVNEHELDRIATLLGATDNSPSVHPGSATSRAAGPQCDAGSAAQAGTGSAAATATGGSPYGESTAISLSGNDSRTDPATGSSAGAASGADPVAPGSARSVETLLAAVASATGCDVICTLGAAGAAYRVGGVFGRAAARPVEAVDTTAAGDTFAGYFAALADLPLPQRLQRALDAASLAVTRPGTSPSIPARAEVEALEPLSHESHAAPPEADAAATETAAVHSHRGTGPAAAPVPDPVAAPAAAANTTERNTAR